MIHILQQAKGLGMTGEDEGTREKERSDRRDDESSPSLGYYGRHANERQRYTNKQTGRQTDNGQTVEDERGFCYNPSARD